MREPIFKCTAGSCIGPLRPCRPAGVAGRPSTFCRASVTLCLCGQFLRASQAV